MDMLTALVCLLNDDEQAPHRFPALFYEFVDFLLHSMFSMDSIIL